MTATLEQTQQDLARWLEIARQGEEVVITQGGEPVAKLVGVPIQPAAVVDQESPTQQTKRPMGEVLDEIHARQRARGHVPMTKEEVDRYIEEERNSWD